MDALLLAVDLALALELALVAAQVIPTFEIGHAWKIALIGTLLLGALNRLADAAQLILQMRGLYSETGMNIQDPTHLLTRSILVVVLGYMLCRFYRQLLWPDKGPVP